MTLPKKKSRLITIDTTKYHWLVGPNDGYNVFVAEKVGIKGRKIEIYFDTDINKFWVEFPHVQDLNLKIIKPRDAALIIRQAINQGWNPDEKGEPIVFDLKSEKLIKRQKASR